MYYCIVHLALSTITQPNTQAYAYSSACMQFIFPNATITWLARCCAAADIRPTLPGYKDLLGQSKALMHVLQIEGAGTDLQVRFESSQDRLFDWFFFLFRRHIEVLPTTDAHSGPTATTSWPGSQPKLLWRQCACTECLYLRITLEQAPQASRCRVAALC